MTLDLRCLPHRRPRLQEIILIDIGLLKTLAQAEKGAKGVGKG